jgi:CBS domain-containing protein
MAQKSSETPTESGSRSFGEAEPFRRGPGSNGNGGGTQTNPGANVGSSWQESERRGASESRAQQGRYYQSALERGRWNERDRWRERGQGRGFDKDLSFRSGRPEAGEERGRLGAGEWDMRRQGLWQRESLTVRDIMTHNIKAVSPESTLKEAAQIMRDENVGIVPVVDQNRRLLGVLTDRDIVVRVVAEDRMPAQVRVQEVMTEDVEVVTEDEEVRDVIELMGKKQIRRVPVVDQNDRLVGIVSLGDIANRADYDEELQEALQKISSRRSFWNRLFG